MNPKAIALKAIEQSVVHASDNLYRARMQFQHLSIEELAEPYGRSGLSKAHLLGHYITQHQGLISALEWLKKQEG